MTSTPVSRMGFCSSEVVPFFVIETKHGGPVVSSQSTMGVSAKAAGANANAHGPRRMDAKKTRIADNYHGSRRRHRLRAVGKKLAIGLAAVAAPLAGDELLADPDVVATRIVSIDAPPSAVWPWLVQMGPGRGGAYTYDWIENLFGLGMRSADTVHPEWQHLEVGDTPSVPPGKDPGPNAMRVRILQQESALVTASDDGTWVWAFVLEPDGAGTRLISRNRIKSGGSL